MTIAIIGAAGMLGRKLAARLVAARWDDHLLLLDVVAPSAPAGFAGTADCRAADLALPGTAEALVAARPGIIFHLAAIVSAEAEVDFDKGYRINLDGTRALFEAIRVAHLADGYCPRVVFTSSCAVFGAPLPDPVPQHFHLTPLTSYGTQKAICELLLADYARRGFFDGVGLRLPTICIRPGAPNRAASGFFSSILREPLIGREAILPVRDSLRHWHASPRAAVGFLLHAARLDTAPLGAQRNLTLPGLSATVADQIEALRRVAGDAAVALIRRVPDPAIDAIVSGWAAGFDASEALALGFAADASFDAIIAAHIEDELDGRIGPR